MKGKLRDLKTSHFGIQKSPGNTCRVWIKFGLQSGLCRQTTFCNQECMDKVKSLSSKHAINIDMFPKLVWDLQFQQSESVPPVCYRVETEASRAVSHEHDKERGGGGVNLFYCTYVFCLFLHFWLPPKNLTVINRQQVVLFCLNKDKRKKKREQKQRWTSTKKRPIKLQPKPGCYNNNNINNHQQEYSQKQQ